MGILNWLRHGNNHAGSEQDRQQVGKALARIAKLNPQLSVARHFQARLEPAVAAAIKYMTGLVATMPAAREASASTWASDPYIHAFFAAPDDVSRSFSRSTELRAFLEKNADLPEVYAVLGMSMEERKTAGLAMQGETIRSDMVRTTVSFGDHKTRVFGRTEAELRQEIVRRLLEQLGLDALADIAENKSRRDMLEQERTLLNARLQLLERQGTGMRSVVGSDAPVPSEELARLQTQIDENEQSLHNLGLRTEAAERDLDHLCAVLDDPSPHIYVENRQLRLDKMNVVVPEEDTTSGDAFTFQLARIPTTPPQVRAFTLVRFPRSEMLPATDLLNEAVRQLMIR